MKRGLRDLSCVFLAERISEAPHGGFAPGKSPSQMEKDEAFDIRKDLFIVMMILENGPETVLGCGITIIHQICGCLDNVADLLFTVFTDKLVPKK